MTGPERYALRLYLAGPAGSGKSTVAQVLVARHGFRRIALGDLPRALAESRGLRPERAVLQALGDEIRGTEPGRLAMLALARLEGTERAVVDGVRLSAEAEVLRAAGFAGVWVSTPYLLRRRRLDERGERWLRGEGRHQTEAQVPFLRTDFELDGSGDLSALAAAVGSLVSALEARAAARGAGER